MSAATHELPTNTTLERAAEGLALATLVVSPLAVGGAPIPVALGVAGASVGALGLLLAARHGRAPRTGWLPLALALCAAFAALQLLPLPPAILDAIAPATSDVLANIHRDAGARARWRPISLDSAATLREVAKLAGWIALLVVLQHRASRSQRARRRTLVALAGVGALVSAIGLAHRAAGASRLFGLWEYSTEQPLVTTFGNPNHLAGVLVATGLVALGLAREAKGRAALGWLVAGLGTLAGAILTGSTGGRVGLCVGLAVLLVLRWTSAPRVRDDGEGRAPGFLDSWRAFAIACAIVATPLVIIYSGVPLSSVRDLLPIELVESKGAPARAAVSMARSQPLTGIGRGAFEAAHTPFLALPSPVTYTHAENELLQAFAELGVVFGGVYVIAVLAAVLALVRVGRRSWTEAAAASAAVALVVHNLVDFSLQFAAGLVLVALVAHPLRHARRLARPMALGFASALLVAVLAAPIFARADVERDLEELVALSRSDATIEELEAAANAALEKRPADYLPSQVVATRALADEDGARRALPWLNRLLSQHPQSGAAHLLTAEAMARLGHRDQALAEYRAAGNRGANAMPRVLARFAEPEAWLAAAPEQPIAALEAARALDGAGHRKEAVEIAERAIALSPDHFELGEFLVRTYPRVGRAQEAPALAARLRAAHAEIGHAWALEAISHFEAGRPDESRRVYEEGLEHLPRHEELVLSLGWLERSQRAYERAFRVLDQFPPDAPASARFNYHLLRGGLFSDQKAWSEARADYQQALLIQPDRSDLWLVLTEVNLELGRVDEARDTLAHVAQGTVGRDVVARRLDEKLRRVEDTHRELLIEAGGR